MTMCTVTSFLCQSASVVCLVPEFLAWVDFLAMGDSRGQVCHGLAGSKLGKTRNGDLYGVFG